MAASSRSADTQCQPQSVCNQISRGFSASCGFDKTKFSFAHDGVDTCADERQYACDCGECFHMLRRRPSLKG